MVKHATKNEKKKGKNTVIKIINNLKPLSD